MILLLIIYWHRNDLKAAIMTENESIRPDIIRPFLSSSDAPRLINYRREKKLSLDTKKKLMESHIYEKKVEILRYKSHNNEIECHSGPCTHVIS